MPTPTYTPLATITLSSSANNVTFSSIPTSGYRDLILVVNGRSTYTTDAADGVSVRLNSDTAANYTYIRMGGTGSSAFVDAATSQTRAFVASMRSSGSSNTDPSVAIIQIMDYSASDKYKTILGRGNSTAGDGVTAHASRWANTVAMTTLAVFPERGLQGSSSQWAIGTTFNLFGIAS
jgi:hypothetical protein